MPGSPARGSAGGFSENDPNHEPDNEEAENKLDFVLGGPMPDHVLRSFKEGITRGTAVRKGNSAAESQAQQGKQAAPNTSRNLRQVFHCCLERMGPLRLADQPDFLRVDPLETGRQAETDRLRWPDILWRLAKLGPVEREGFRVGRLE